MKRQLSLVLALVMILGSFSAVFAAEATVAEDAAKFLAKEGVLSGYAGSGDLGLEDNLLRQDTLVLVARLLGEFDEAKAHEGEVTYADVNDPTYVPLAAWAKENDTFVGHSDEKFGFGENLTAQEYAKVLLVALEYTVGPNGDKDVSWKDALVKAKDLGILADVDVKNETEITRGEMAVMTFNALGTKLNGSDKTLADKLGIEMPEAGDLTAEVNETENLKEVVLELSNAKLADAEKLENANNYRVDKLKVDKATVDGNNVILVVSEALVKGRSYELNVRSIDKAINKTYKFKANDNTSPKVVDVEVLGEYGIKVTTSEPVRFPAERNFLVDGKNVAMVVEQYGREIVLTPYHKAAFANSAEKLTVKELVDYAGYKAALEDFEIEIAKDDVAPEVTDVVVKGNVVEVTFDKDVYADSVEGYVNRKDVGNISYKSGRSTTYTIEETEEGVNYGNKFDTNKVRYVFKDILPRGTEVTIEGVQNHSKVTMKAVTEVVREVKDDLEPEIIDTDVDKDIAAGTATIELEFDKNVYGNLNKIASHFELYERDVAKRNAVSENIVSAEYKVKDGKTLEDTIIVKLENLKENNKEKEYDYILEVFGFEDGNRNRMYRDYVEFELVPAKVFDVVGSIEYNKNNKEETEISIRFTRPVDRVRAEDETNYLFRKTEGGKPADIKDLDGEIIVERDGKTVTLVLPRFRDKGYNYLEILATLRDKDNNKLSDSRVYDLNTRNLVEDKKDPVDTKALDAVLAKVEELVKEDYTAETWAVLAEALELPETTQKEVDAKVEAIEKAIKALGVVEEGELEATYQAIPFLGSTTVFVEFNHASALNKVAKVEVNEVEYTTHTVDTVNNVVQLVIDSHVEVETVVVTMNNGDVVTATK